AVIDAQQNLTTATDKQGAAQEFLNKSIQRYIQDQQKELTAAQQTAVEDAIHYNDLLKERQSIIAESAKQEYDVLSAGVLTRQRTVAQTKGAQISQIEKERDLQLKQINQQL